MNVFTTKKIKKGINFLDLTPIKKFEDETDENGVISILIPRFKNPRMAKFFLSRNKSNIFRVKLDELGSATWKELDGKQNVLDICKKLNSELGEKVQPAEQRITQFLSILYQQRCITFKEIQKK